MLTLPARIRNGTVQVVKDPGLTDNDEILVLVLNKDRETGIQSDRNRKISDAKRAARKRLRGE